MAVVAVLLHHLRGPGMPTVPGGYLGVDVVFVLSGYLITSLLLERAPFGGVRFGRCSAVRACRLLPALCALWPSAPCRA